jgi:polysaccharide deacetylase 2 family uncharacterized protein YibQ
MGTETQTTKLNNRTFAGILNDTDILETAHHYVVNYHMTLVDADVQNDKCLIKKAELGIGTRIDLTEPLVDIDTERKEVEKEMKQASKLARTKPNDKSSDGLTHKEVYNLYKSLLGNLDRIKEVIVDEIKEQIFDTVNANETSKYKDIQIENINFVRFNKLKMSSKTRICKAIM